MSGSKAAAADFEEFAHARSGQLLRTACLLTGDWHMAEDLVQETFGKLFPRWNRVSEMDAPMAYAHRTLVRTFLSVRRLKRWSEYPAEELPDAHAPDGQDIELRLTLLEGLARLSPDDRAVLVLRYWEDYAALFPAAIAVAAVEVVLTRRPGTDAARRRGVAAVAGLWPRVRRCRRHPLVVVAALLVAAQYCWRAALAVFLGPLDFDGLW
ncbi:SigE family RNA polymerase sigma factor [Embleya sp. NPDC127516]|uniref:SigE family RNA polymerase sigma factor n=1 Tax=Embleya sp. NPDC127516 TaxID=3363990 RepID=UPI003820CF58